MGSGKKVDQGPPLKLPSIPNAKRGVTEIAGFIHHGPLDFITTPHTGGSWQTKTTRSQSNMTFRPFPRFACLVWGVFMVYKKEEALTKHELVDYDQSVDYDQGYCAAKVG